MECGGKRSATPLWIVRTNYNAVASSLCRRTPKETIMTERIFNFSAAPAVIPVPVLEEAQRDMLALPGVGMSVMQISHRSKTFDAIIAGAHARLRGLPNIPKRHTGPVL